MIKFRRTIPVLLAVGLVLVVAPQIAMGCPTCKDGLHDDGTAAAYAVSILFMMGMPFVIMTFWVTTIVRMRAKMKNNPGTMLLNGMPVVGNVPQGVPALPVE